MPALVTAGMGVLVGVFSALFGVGGGVLMVPFMVLVLGLGQHLAEGTSLLVIVPTALVGAVAHAKHGYVDRPAALMLAIGGVVGALAGALIGLQLPGELLRNLFGSLVGVVGIKLILDGIREPTGGPDGASRRDKERG